MHQSLVAAIWLFILTGLLKDGVIIQPVECFPEQHQPNKLGGNKEKNADSPKAAIIRQAPRISKEFSSLYNVDAEKRRKLQEACEEIKCGAECYLARDQGCGWADGTMKCVFDESEETDFPEFSMGICTDCFEAFCGKECKELEANGCTWDAGFCTLDPTGATDSTELEDGICSNAIIPFIQTIFFIPVIVISILVGGGCVVGLCVLVFCKMLQDRNGTHAGVTLAGPTYYPPVHQPIVFHTIQTHLVSSSPPLQQHDEIAVAVVVDDPYQDNGAIPQQPGAQRPNKTVDV